jgi:hypothetical protein
MGGAKVLVVAAVLGLAGYMVWHSHRVHVERKAIEGITDARGFMEFSPPGGAKTNEVVILAAQNCPHDGALRAERLAGEMAERHVRFVRTSHATFQPSPDDDIDQFMKRHNDVMNSDVPIVFVNGRVKSNPDVDDVLAEYEEATR